MIKDDIKIDCYKYFNKKRKAITNDILSKYTDNKKQIEILADVPDIISILEAPEKISNNYGFGYDNVLYRTFQFLGILPTRESALKAEARKLKIRPESQEYHNLNKNFRLPKPNKEELKELLNIQAVKYVLDSFLTNLKNKYETMGYKEKLEQINNQEKQAILSIENYDNNLEKMQNKHFSEQINLLKNYIPNYEIIKYLPPYKLEDFISSFASLVSLDLSNSQDLDFLSIFKKRKFVKTLKTIGFNLGENLEDYLYNPKVQEVIFNKDLKEQLKILKDNQTLELLNNNEFFVSALQLADEIDPTIGTYETMNGIYNYLTNDNSVAAFAGSLVSKSGDLYTVTVCKSALLGSDKTTIHELGHVIEALLIKQPDKTKTVTCSGFHVSIDDNSDKKYDGKTPLFKSSVINQIPDRYEILNEIINDYFSVKVAKVLHSKGIKLNLGEQTEKSRSTYALGFSLLEPFIEKYQQELIDARLSDNPLSFADFVGQENFDALADTCTKYIEYATQSDNYKNFVREVNDIHDKMKQPYQNPVYDALKYDIKWSDNAQEFIKHFKTVQSIMEKIDEKQKNN